MAKKKPIVSKEGQWKYPGQETIIPNANGRITMQGVPYPVLGIDDQGYSQMMMPGAEYQFPGNSVYEIPMAKNGGTRKVKIHGLPKAQNGEEVQTVYTAGTNEPWEPLPDMNPEEAKQWGRLRDDAVGITGNYATNAQIYATYKRAKEMGLGYDQYVSNEKAKAQQQRDAIVPKPIPGLGYDVNQLKKLSELPGSPFMYNQSTGEYYLPYGDSFKISDPALRTNPYNRPLWEASLDPDYDSEFYAKYHNDGVAESIANINDPLKNFNVPAGTAITPELIEERRKSEIDWFNRMYGVKYDPTVDYTITPDEVKQHLFKKPDKKEPVNRQAFYNRLSNSYQDLLGHIPAYKYGDDPQEKYDIIKTRERDKEIKSELDQPLAKFLGATGDKINPNVLKRANAIASDKVAELALLDFNNIVTPTLNGTIDNGLSSGEASFSPLDVANTEEFRSFMNMDPKLLEAIVNSPFGGGTINLSNNKDAVGNNLAIGTSEAKKLLAIRNAIGGSDMWSYLNNPTPVDAMIQGTANTLSWMAGNENAEGPGTLGEMAHNLTGYQAQNKGLNIADVIGGASEIGGNLLTNTWNGQKTDVPTYRTKPIFHSYTDPTMANLTQGAFDMINDPVGLLTGTKAIGAVSDIVGDAFRAGKKFNRLERRLVHAYGAGSDMPSNLAFANLSRTKEGFDFPDGTDFKKIVSENKPKIFSPIDTQLYGKNPKTGKSVLDMSGQYGDYLYRSGSQPIIEDAKYWNDLAGRTDLKEGSKITPELARLHIKNVLDIKKPKASSAKNKGVKFDYYKSTIAKKDYTNASAPKKWTKEELESHIGYLSREADDSTVIGLLKNTKSRDMQEKGIDFLNNAGPYALAGLGGLGALALLEDDYIRPLANKYFPAFANKLGLNDLEVDKDQVTIDLSEEGSKLSAVRVNETEADGNVILGGEFIYNNPNTVNSIKWFKENPTASLGDPSDEYGEITTETAPGFWGLENGKLKAGALQDFSDETVVVPIRPSTNAFKPIRQAGVAEDGGLRMITDPDQENDGLVFNNARTQGKLLFYSPKTGKSYYVYNNNPQSTAAEINRLVSENEDLRYIMLDNGRYSHYKDKGTEKLTEEDFKEYAAGDIGKEGNPGYNIVFKRKDSKKFGGPINFRNGGQLPKAQFGPPTASDSAMVASKASQVGNWLVNNGYTQLNSNPANFSNPAAFRQDLEGGIRRFTNANNSGNIIDFRTGNRGSFPGNYTLGYNGNNVVWSQRDMASGVLNPNIPPSYYDTRILPQRFDVYDASNQFGNYDSVGKYTYEKLAVTPWKKLTNEQKIKRLKRYGASGSPYKDPRVGIKELKGLIEDQKTKKIAKVEPPVVEQPSQISNPPANVRIPFAADPIRRQFPINMTGDEALDRLNQQLYGNFGTLTEDGYIPTDDPKYYPYKGMGPGTPAVRRSYGKFANGGDISIPDLKRVKIHALPKAQDGTPRVKLQEIQDLQDKYAVPSGYVRVPDVVRQQRLAKGIPANQIPEFEKITKSVSPKLQSIIDTQEARSAEDKKTEEIEKYKRDVKKFRPAPINDPAGLPSVPIFEAALMAPVALASTAAALNAPLLGTGVSAANIINPLFFGQGIKNTLDSQSDMRKSWSNLYNDRTKSNLLDAALETGLNSLNFLGAKSLGSDLNKIGNYAGNTVNSIRNDFNVIKNARKYAADMQWQAPDDVFNVINTQRSGQLGSKQLRLKGSPNAMANSETSNSIVKGMRSIEHQEMVENGKKLYNYSFIPRAEAEKLLNSNPNISKRIVTGDSFDFLSPPELQSRDALQKAFEEGDRFGLMWGVKDLDKYTQMSKVPLDAYKFLREERAKVAKEKSDVNSKISTLNFKIANKEDEVFREYLINQKGLSQQDASDIVDRGITPPGTTRATFYFEAKPYWESKLKPTGIYDELDKLKKQQSDIPFKEARLTRDNTFIQNELDLVDKYSENFLDPEFKRKIEDLYRQAGANMPFSTNITRNVNPANSKLIYYNQNEPTFLGLPDHSKQYLTNNFQTLGGFANSEGTYTIAGKSWFNTPYEAIWLRKPKMEKLEYDEFVKPGPVDVLNPETWLNPFRKGRNITKEKLVPVEGADTTPELVYDDRVRMNSPSAIGDVAAHEAGHPLQKIYDWSHTLGGYDTDYNYFKSNDLNPLSKRFQDAMVEPVKSTSTGYTNETWLASPMELHSELMAARLRQARKLMTDENLSMEDAIKRIKGLEKQGDTDLFKSYLSNAKPSDGGLNKHFKDTTPESERIELLIRLPKDGNMPKNIGDYQEILRMSRKNADTYNSNSELARANRDALTFTNSPANKAKLQAFRPGQNFSVTNQTARFIDDPEAIKLFGDYDPSMSIEKYLGSSRGAYGARDYGDMSDVVLVDKFAPHTSNIPSKSIYTDALHENTHSRSIRLQATDEEKQIASEAWQPMITEKAKTEAFGMPEEEAFAVQNELRIDKLKDIDGTRVYTEKDIPEIKKGLEEMINVDHHGYLNGVKVEDFNMKALINSLNKIGLGVGVGTVIGVGATQEKKKGGQIRKLQNGGSPYTIPEQSYRDPNFVREEGREWYDPASETIYMRPSYPNVIHEQMVKYHELGHHKQKLKGKLSSTEYWPGPLKEPAIGASDEMIHSYYNRAGQDVRNLMNAAPQSTFFGIPEGVAVTGFQNKTYDTPGTTEYDAENPNEPRTLYRGKPVVKNAIDKTLNREYKDPEMMFKDKYNTSLTQEEEKEFNNWIKTESKKQGRDILMDKGAYDIQGFWKSGDWKNRDADNHGTDTWKKPNHPTFSNQSKYHGAGGWYGGNWTEQAGYQPSKQTLNNYGLDYYNWLFNNEPNRPEHLDMNRYDGENMGAPVIYKQGGSVKRVKINALPNNWKTK